MKIKTKLDWKNEKNLISSIDFKVLYFLRFVNVPTNERSKSVMRKGRYASVEFGWLDAAYIDVMTVELYDNVSSGNDDVKETLECIEE